MSPHSHAQNRAKGNIGEELAVGYLQKKGYVIRHRNFYMRGGEIDIIADKPGGILAFIEVKARQDLRHGQPYESVTPMKIRRLYKSIQLYLLINKLHERKLSLEVVSILMSADMTIRHIDHFEDLGVGM